MPPGSPPAMERRRRSRAALRATWSPSATSVRHATPSARFARRRPSASRSRRAQILASFKSRALRPRAGAAATGRPTRRRFATTLRRQMRSVPKMTTSSPRESASAQVCAINSSSASIEGSIRTEKGSAPASAARGSSAPFAGLPSAETPSPTTRTRSTTRTSPTSPPRPRSALPAPTRTSSA